MNGKATNPGVLSWLRNVLQPEYRNPERAFSDVQDVLQRIETLRLKTDIYSMTASSQAKLQTTTNMPAHANGRSQLLVLLFGTINITFMQRLYGIPIHIWMPQDYPAAAPMVFVVPGPDMGVRPSNHVDVDRRCYHPYLAYWSMDAHSSNLLGVIQSLQEVFGKAPPLYTLPPAAARPEHSSRPAIPAKEEQRSRTSTPVVPAKEQFTSQRAEVQYAQQSATPRKQVNQGEESSSRQTQPPAVPAKELNRAQSDGLDYSLRPPPTLPTTDQLASSGRAPHKHASMSLRDTPRVAQSAQELQSATKQQHEIRRAADVILQEKASSSHATFLQQVAALDASREALKLVEAEYEARLRDLEHVSQVASANAATLREKSLQAKLVIEKSNELGPPDVDTCLVAPDVVSNQLYDLIAGEAAIEDCIYALGKSLENEKISLENFLKSVKVLAREQFMHRALIQRITTVLKLS